MIDLRRRDGRPLLVGHRGAAALAPENTLRAFRAGDDRGLPSHDRESLFQRTVEVVAESGRDARDCCHDPRSTCLRGYCQDRPDALLRCGSRVGCLSDQMDISRQWRPDGGRGPDGDQPARLPVEYARSPHRRTLGVTGVSQLIEDATGASLAHLLIRPDGWT